jgi:nucleotide-binding universal stress UspA family protein
MFSTVAVGLDGSATASRAVETAAELARRFDAELVLLTAYKRGGTMHSLDGEVDWAEQSAARQGELVTRAEQRLKDAGVRCSVRSGEGHPADVLVELAETCGADVLVIGNKGMQHRVKGSVPNTVTHKANCSVLLVKTT